jgi:predicted ester cyclase
MRAIRFALVTSLALAACGGEEPAPQPPPPPPPAPPPTASVATPPPADTTPPPPPKPTLAELIPQTLKTLGDAMNAHDAQKVAGTMTDDVTITGYGEGHSKSQYVTGLGGMFGVFSDMKSAPTRVFIKGNVVVAEVVWAGTMTGDFHDIKASKKPVGSMIAQTYVFNDDGLIKELHHYGDMGGIMAQMKGGKGAPAVPTLPTNQPEMHVAKGTPDEDKLADLGKAIDVGMSKDDAKVAIDGLADDADVWFNITGQPATKGKKDLTKELTNWFKAIPDQKWKTVSSWGIDGFAVVEHSVSGTQKGALGPIKASNKPVADWAFLEIVQPTADGKIQHLWSYGNVVDLMMQTGAMKMPGEKTEAAPAKGEAKSAPGSAAPKK